MRRALSILAIALPALLSAACDNPAATQEQPLEMQTVESAAPRLSAIDPPPMLQDNLPQRAAVTTPKPAGEPAGGAKPGDTKPATPSAEDEMKAKTNLPFTPLIAMDPVDGSKVSITPDTPVYSYKDRWYYFSSAANKATFRANPEVYATGSLSSY
ncbi:MAG TPA: YHS domain-containing protein [Thermoanaerobaculia bacterium]|nr:YHS domain-containing protein [Thermoanaerobaculia bacterium]